MEDDVVIKVENVSKKFTRSIKRSMLYGSNDLVKSIFGKTPSTATLRKGEFWSLRNVNFEVKKGEMFALVGANGSGKSTLLRLIAGIFPPDGGKIMVKGKIGALIAVGAGFHPHMTGRENIYLNGTILGMTKEEIAIKFTDILEFADIGDFIDAPVSTYSSGMTVRLGFAIAIHCEPEIVLVDEILAVGDSQFQRKCLNKIEEKKKEGVTFILVTHNMQQVETMCDRAVYLKEGNQIKEGQPREVIGQYELDQMSQGQEDYIDYKEKYNESLVNSLKLVDKTTGYGTDEIKIDLVQTLDRNDNFVVDFQTGDLLKLIIDLQTQRRYDDVFCFIRIGYIQDLKTNTVESVLGVKKQLNLKKGKSSINLLIPELGLTTGIYRVTLHLFDKSSLTPYFQGSFGYFNFKNSKATLLKVGQLGQPYYWLDSEKILID